MHYATHTSSLVTAVVIYVVDIQGYKQGSQHTMVAAGEKEMKGLVGSVYILAWFSYILFVFSCILINLSIVRIKLNQILIYKLEIYNKRYYNCKIRMHLILYSSDIL